MQRSGVWWCQNSFALPRTPHRGHHTPDTRDLARSQVTCLSATTPSHSGRNTAWTRSRAPLFLYMSLLNLSCVLVHAGQPQSSLSRALRRAAGSIPRQTGCKLIVQIVHTSWFRLSRPLWQTQIPAVDKVSISPRGEAIIIKSSRLISVMTSQDRLAAEVSKEGVKIDPRAHVCCHVRGHVHNC